MKRLLPVVILLMSFSLSKGGDQAKDSEKKAFKIRTDWKKSKDGKLAISLAVKKRTFKKGEAIVLHCAIKNLSDKPLTIIKAFGDEFYSISSGLTIVGPDGRVTYNGPMKSYMLGEDAFIELKPGEMSEGTLTLPKMGSVLKGFARLGDYTITYVHRSHGSFGPGKAKNSWEGALKTGTIKVTIK